MIPSIIHYCWFGKGDKPAAIKEYISNWRIKLPDYEIKEWNEDNFDIYEAPIYVQEAYSKKKYAFVSDYVRIKVLSEFGGVYFDTDIEVVRNFDSLLEGKSLVLGFESDGLLETAFIACEKEHPFICEFLRTYNDRRFIMPDGTYDTTDINSHMSEQAKKLGIDLTNEKIQHIGDGIIIYPREYFAAFDIKNWHIKPGVNTYTIHHMNSSWESGKRKVYYKVIMILQTILGYEGYDKLKFLYDRIKGKW